LDLPAWRRPGVVAGFLSLLGVTIEWRGEENLPPGRHVLVSNHVSNGDLLMLFGRPRRYLHLITPLLPKPVFKTANLPAILAPANKDTYEALAEVAGGSGGGGGASSSSGGRHEAPAHVRPASGSGAWSSSSNTSGSAAPDVPCAAVGQRRRRRLPPESEAAPVHLFPEGGMTNGRGMMAFSRGFTRFAPGGAVVPVALRLRAPFAQVRPARVRWASAGPTAARKGPRGLSRGLSLPSSRPTPSAPPRRHALARCPRPSTSRRCVTTR
jgi:hypothetical protein